MAYGGHIRMGLLPSSMFANGHTFYLQRMYAEHGVKPYVVHNTFQYAGTEGKRHRCIWLPHDLSSSREQVLFMSCHFDLG